MKYKVIINAEVEVDATNPNGAIDKAIANLDDSHLTIYEKRDEGDNWDEI